MPPGRLQVKCLLLQGKGRLPATGRQTSNARSETSVAERVADPHGMVMKAEDDTIRLHPPGQPSTEFRDTWYFSIAVGKYQIAWFYFGSQFAC